MKAFVINSNICTSAEQLYPYSKFMDTICENTGNSYISWSIMKELGISLDSIKGYNIPNIYSYDFQNNMDRDLDIINSECTHVVLCLQDQIRSIHPYGMKLPYLNLTKFLAGINIPILIVSLGANSLSGFVPNFHKMLDRDLVRFLCFLSNQTEQIGIRGYYTEEVLYKLGIKNTHVIGCPTYYETGWNRCIEKPVFSRGMRLATSTGLNLTKRSDAIYLQDSQVHEARLIQSYYYGEKQLLSPKEFRRLKKGIYRFFSSMSAWKKDIAQMDFYVGMRVHGAMVALNSGVPVVVVNPDSRAREMCEYMNIPYHPEFRWSNNLAEIINTCSYEKMNREYNQKMQDFIDFLEANHFHYSPNEKDMGGVILPISKSITAETIHGAEIIRQLFYRIFSPKMGERRSRAKELLGF